MSLAKKGKVFSKEHRQNLSKASKGKIKPWLKGIKKAKLSEEHKEKISKSMKELLMSGENSPNWQGGISFEPYSIDWTETLKRAIRERDHYLCQVCSQYGNAVHHIDYDKKNCNPNNLITTCVSCNTKANFNREYWTNYFSIKLTN